VTVPSLLALLSVSAFQETGYFLPFLGAQLTNLLPKQVVIFSWPVSFVLLVNLFLQMEPSLNTFFFGFPLLSIVEPLVKFFDHHVDLVHPPLLHQRWELLIFRFAPLRVVTRAIFTYCFFFLNYTIWGIKLLLNLFFKLLSGSSGVVDHLHMPYDVDLLIWLAACLVCLFTGSILWTIEARLILVWHNRLLGCQRSRGHTPLGVITAML